MPRKKKEEVKEEVIIKEEPKKLDFGTGWAAVNNRIQYEQREGK